MNASIEQSLHAIQAWVEARDYKGYDPGDGLTSFLRPLAFGNHFLERVLQQFIWKSPINLRPLVGIVPLDSTKGRGFMAWGYLLLYKASGQQQYRDKAIQCLDWLNGARENGHAGHCWGNHFDFATRAGKMKAHTPTIVWSGLIGQAYLEAFEQTNEVRFLDIAESICRWVLSLPKQQTHEGFCFSYTSAAHTFVHNSNLLGAALLARTWKHRRNEEFRTAAAEAVRYSCSCQRPDGAWWYGEEPKYHWIDNFHSAYNLDSIKRYIECTGDDTFRKHLVLGYNYFISTFFVRNGCPRYYDNRIYPVDIQCAAQAIDTFCFFADQDPDALKMGEKVALWTLENMQAPSGYFYYRRYPVWTAKTPYFHWGQATMFKALAHLLLVSRKRFDSASDATHESVTTHP